MRANRGTTIIQEKIAWKHQQRCMRTYYDINFRENRRENTVSNLSRRIAALSPAQRRLLETQLQGRKSPAVAASPVKRTQPPETMRFSLIFFSGDGGSLKHDKYDLLFEAAAFADQNCFEAVWIPERHFTRFGGLYPSPAVIAASLAMVTQHIQIRAGSIVLPLQHPARVVEEWSIVDNLSKGRVGIACASGWVQDDFVLSRTTYVNRRQVFDEMFGIIKQLWKGGPVQFTTVEGNDVTIEIFPKPIQPDLPVWITSSGNPATWVKAGKLGANVLTALLQISLDELATNIALYRQTLEENGHDPVRGQVTLMLHTFVSGDQIAVRRAVEEPLRAYLRTHIDIYDHMARHLNFNIDPRTFTEDDKETLATFAFERYYNTNGLFGTPESCSETVARFHAMGVNEIASLIDFGIDTPTVLAGLHYLDQLRQAAARR